MAEFHRWLRGSDARDGQTSLKGTFGTLCKTNSSLTATSATGYKAEINCASNGVRNTDWAMDVVKMEPVVKNGTNSKKVNEAGSFIWRGLRRRKRGAMMVKENSKRWKIR